MLIKQRLYILLTALLLIAGNLRAQVISDNSVSGDTITLKYMVPVGEIRKDDELLIRPCLLCDTMDEVLDTIIVRGKRLAQEKHRAYVLTGAKKRGEPEQSVMPAEYTKRGIQCEVKLPLAKYKWVVLNPVRLCIERERTNCCKTDTLPTLCSIPFQSDYEEPEPIVEIVDTVPVDTVEIVEIDTVPVVPDIVEDAPIVGNMDDYKQFDTNMALGEDSSAIYVYFEVDKIVIKREYMGNAPRLDSIMHLVDAIHSDSTLEVGKIQILGLASIEGNNPHNIWLGAERGKALKNYIQQHVALPDSCFDVVNGGEAWAEVRYYAETHDFIGNKQVLDIIHTVDNLDKREALLRQLNGGKTYQHLKVNLFRTLRYSGYLRIYYRAKPKDQKQQQSTNQ